jgi:2-methylisocitrate lyase-like PEP mutase family enzyme
MTTTDRATRAEHFRELNVTGHLLLPNAWDAASARVFERAQFPAIGTTSAGIATARGLPDGETIGRDRMLAEIRTIVEAVRVPVTADIEAGYGDATGDVAQTVAAILELGVVGVNLEDRVHRRAGAHLYNIDEQQARIAAARNEADRHGIHLVINARTDTYLLAVGSSLDERLTLTIERGNAYLNAGADVVFVPGVIDVGTIGRLAGALDGPLNVMAMPGAPDAATLFAAGARRVSMGNTAMLAVLGALDAIARDVITTGTWASIERSFYGFQEADALFEPTRSSLLESP